MNSIKTPDLQSSASILVAEDEIELLDAFSSALTTASYRVVRATNGQEAIAKLRNQKFDTVVLDLRMPKVTGDRVLEVMAQDPTHANCPVILSSAYIDPPLIRAMTERAQLHFLPKPFGMNVLVEKVGALISGRRAVLDARMVNAIRVALPLALGETAKATAQPGELALRKPQDVSGDASALVQAVGPCFKGTIALCFKTSALGALDEHLATPGAKRANPNGEVRAEAVSELFLAVLAKVRDTFAQEGLTLQATPPTLLVRPAHAIRHPSNGPVITLPFVSPEFGAFSVELCGA